MSLNLILFLLFPFLMVPLVYHVGKKNEEARNTLMVFVMSFQCLLLYMLHREMGHGVLEINVAHIMGTGLHLKLDPLRMIFVGLTTIVWLLTTIYTTQYLIRYKNRNRYYAFFLLTYGSTIGMFLSENLLNVFTFFEMISFTSYILVIHDEDEYSHDAGMSYISMAIAGGLVQLLGIFLVFQYTGSLDIVVIGERIQDLGTVKYVIATLLTVGFAVKASLYPLHVWLPKAHPAAPAPASAVLSGILIKAGVFGILNVQMYIMAGDPYYSWVLLGLGFMNMVLGGILACFQRNIKRILAYSSMSQVGYIIVGIAMIGLLGDHNYYAVAGTLLYVLNHGLFKVLLFLGAGIIYMVLHELSINKIVGFGVTKRRLKLFFLIGIGGLIGFPGFNGFVSKTLIHHGVEELAHIYHMDALKGLDVLYYLASAITVAYMLKLFIHVFVVNDDKYHGQFKKYITNLALLPMGILSAMVIYLGVRYEGILHYINYAVEMMGFHVDDHIHVYTLESVGTSLLITLLGVFIYVFVIRRVLLKEKQYVNPSLEWVALEEDVYKPFFRMLYHDFSKFFHWIDTFAIRTFERIRLAFVKVGELDLDQFFHMIETGFKEKHMNLAENVETLKGSAEASLKKHHGRLIEPQDLEVYKKSKVKINSFNDLVRFAYSRLNTIVYGIFIVGMILVVMLYSVVMM